MSSIMALRRSPYPGALTAQTLNVPRSRLMTRVASASPSTSSAMINRGLPCWTTFSKHRHHVFDAADFLFEHQDVGVFEDGFHAGAVGDEVGRQVAAIELHPFDPLLFGLKAFAFIDGDHTVFPNFAHRVGKQVADLAIVVAGDRCDVCHGRPDL